MKTPFDLKICKLTGEDWNRDDVSQLARQLLEKQGEYRYSIENRVIIIFDRSENSSVKFLKVHESLLVERLVEFFRNPLNYIHLFDDIKCWQAIIMIHPSEYESQDAYYEHSLGEGLREPGKAEYENYLLKAVAEKVDNLIVNPNNKEHGLDGWLVL